MQTQTLGEQLLFTTVLIEITTANEQGTGTGFVFSYQWDGKKVDFLVTNKHVVSSAVAGELLFTRRKGTEPIIGERVNVSIPTFEQQWHGHPNDDIDIAVMLFNPIFQYLENSNTHIFYKTISHSFIPTSEQMSRLDTLEEVAFIGYPIGIFDTTNLTPITRRGVTATPLQLDYKGKPIFLIDASVFPGSSGSPVFIYNSGPHNERGMFNFSERFLFLGVIAEVVIMPDYGQIEFVPIPTSQTPVVKTYHMIDLGIVYKSSTVLETVLDYLDKRGLR